MWRNWNSQQPQNVLVVGVSLGFMGYPFASIDSKGQLEGFDIDVAYAVAKKLNKDIIFNDMQYEFLVAALKSDQMDFISHSLAMTRQRLAHMDMIDVYGQPESTLTFLVWKDFPERIKTINDFKAFVQQETVCVAAGSVWEEILEDYEFHNVLSYERYADLIAALEYKKTMAVLGGPRWVKSFQKKYPTLKILKVKLDKPWAEGVGIALKKGNTELKEKLEKVIAELKQDGTIKKLITKWFGEGANDC
jgi:arginine transport system substrate-binding protein